MTLGSSFVAAGNVDLTAGNEDWTWLPRQEREEIV